MTPKCNEFTNACTQNAQVRCATHARRHTCTRAGALPMVYYYNGNVFHESHCGCACGVASVSRIALLVTSHVGDECTRRNPRTRAVFIARVSHIALVNCTIVRIVRATRARRRFTSPPPWSRFKWSSGRACTGRTAAAGSAMCDTRATHKRHTSTNLQMCVRKTYNCTIVRMSEFGSEQ